MKRSPVPYDVVQVKRDGRWLDYATIKDDQDIEDAKRLVEENATKVRIVSGQQPDWGEVL